MRLVIILACLSLFALAQPALAQQQEPPSRVGQISSVAGNLAFHTAGETQWSAAGVNYPVATGGSFWTDPQARAQIQIGSTTIGMAGGTELDVTNLNDQASQFGLPQGRINLHLRQLDNGQSFEVDLPQGAVWLLQPGSYDIDAGTADQPARVAVFAGSARFVGGGGGADIGVNHGDAAVLTGSNPVAARIEHAAPDTFVEWCAAHDYHAEGLAAAHYVSPQMTGYADLDHYGGWQGNPQYGEVWYPGQVPADWVPYRDGRWIWVQPWGWTWVDQQPWGFAPFHYGRWAYMDDRWGWVPGSYVAQPVYAPALVAFVGAVAGIGLAAGGGPAVGWFPLAPGETYWPSYTQNAYYIRNVNVTNVKNINNIVVQSNGAPPRQIANTNFANRRFATVVPQRVFANADPVAPAAIHVTPAALEKAPVVLHPPQVKPSPWPASAAVQGPQHPRPVPVGPGIAPSVRPAAAVSAVPAGQPRPPGIQPEHAATPGRPGTVPNMASIPPHPGVGNPPERGPHPPAAAGTATTSVPGAPEHSVPHPATAPNTAALPPSHPGAASPAAEARPVIAAPVHPAAGASVRREAPLHPAAPLEPRPAAVNAAHPPATASVHREAPLHPTAPPEPRPAAVNVAHPLAPPHPAPPPAQASHPPAPAVAHPPAPPPHPESPPQTFRPPAPAVARPVPAVVHPPAPPPHPQAAPATPAARSGGKPAPKEKAKDGDNHP